MEYTMENFKDGEFVIACKKKEEAELLMGLFIKDGINWKDGEYLSPKKTYWDEYKSDFYYCHEYGLGFGNIRLTSDKQKIVSSQDFMSANKSNKEKVLEIIGVNIGEPFNIIGSGYNPHSFNKQFNLCNCEGDKCTSKVIDILWENNKIEKIPEDPNTEVKKYIELLSSTTPLTGDVRKGILISLKEILDLKESKSA